ncbi:S-methyl-5-thioribose-1-phosphate isomerase [Streptomyces sp. NPDC008125]|uniref:S-methyl-5-thioribose-1-phosphate isomerase n=1 Tax=Streptomyces sp. NPDC008125 TaxID=3364811 RepID=UPI0036E0D903
MKTSLGWDAGSVLVTDQRALPHEHLMLRLHTVDEVIDAIRTLAVRGAPAIGLTGALGVALSARAHLHDGAADFASVRADAERLVEARPTAVNLAWAVRRVLERLPDGPRAVLDEALAMIAEDEVVNTAAARRAADLVEELAPDRPLRLLTHCNTGRLATGAVGTALGAVLGLAARGRVVEVLAGETRPLLQGSRLTAWELAEAGVPYRLCVDAAGPAAMAQGLVDCVLVGADRIARNGDTANKIGTYALAVAAARHRIPFVVVAPESTWDPELPDGTGIVIEERAGSEVTSLAGHSTAPAGAGAYNPAFDVTPAELITAIVTERRVFRPAASAGTTGTPSPEAGTPTSGVGGTPTQEARATTPGAGAPHARVAGELASLSRTLYERGWMPGTSGNLSARGSWGSGGTALITASGRDKGAMTGADMVPVDAATGRILDPAGPRASAETAIHAAVYRTTDARAVIHVHSPYATAAAVRAAGPRSGPASLLLRDFELLKGLGLADSTRTSVPVFANWPDVTRIADEVAAHLEAHPGAPPGLLIAHHGITVWGADLAQARNRLECFESVFHLMLLDGARPSMPPAAPSPFGGTS